jgi:lysozyme family protein
MKRRREGMPMPRTIKRRAFISGALAAFPAILSCPVRGGEAGGQLSRSAAAAASRFFDRARRIGLLPPQAARAAALPDKLDVAELVLKALEATPRMAGASSVAKDAGEFLSAVTKDERDGLQITEARRPPPPYDENEKLSLRTKFDTCKTLPTHQNELTKAAKIIISPEARSRYKEVSALTADPIIPWYVIGALHYREANLNFLGHLHNGDPLGRKTIQVPKGRPKGPWPPNPYDTRAAWRQSAVDALGELKSITSWKTEQMLYGFEKYNGFGFRWHGVPSAYVWNYSQFYTHGGFPHDNQWDDHYVSRQAGLAPLIKMLVEMVPDIKLEYDS